MSDTGIGNPRSGHSARYPIGHPMVKSMSHKVYLPEKLWHSTRYSCAED
jgi:hypothetical protein